MKFLRVLLSPKYSPIFKMLVQTLLVFALILLPLSINVTSSPPPYSITNTGSSGMSYFNNQAIERGFNTTRTILSTNPILDLPENSILVIAGGAKNYREPELALIESFVLRGGLLLLLISDGPSNRIAQYFGILLSSSYILETESYYRAPDVILVNAPAEFNTTLCLPQSKAIVDILESDAQREVRSFSTQDTAFIDDNNDRMWNEVYEQTGRLKIGSVVARGEGAVIAISSASFLTNDLYSKGFGNIDITISLMGSYTSGEDKLICFEESHKRWPFFTSEGVINQSYGSIILLSKTRLFIFIVALIVLISFYLTPRFQEIFRTEESYKKVISERIWSRRRELYDTFGVPIKPTVEEKYLSTLFFQYELYPEKVYSYYLLEKLQKIPLNLMTEEEKMLFERALTKKIDSKTFLELFKKVEEIQSRGRLI